MRMVKYFQVHDERNLIVYIDLLYSMAENFDSESESDRTILFEKMRDIRHLADQIDELFESIGEKAPSNLNKKEIQEIESIKKNILNSKKQIENRHEEIDQKMKVHKSSNIFTVKTF